MGTIVLLRLRVGETEDALADAERVLKTDEKYLKGLFAKAEALYFKGDFEFALVFYYRGFRACEKSAGPAKQFTLGIQKAKEAIDNAIGNVEHCRLSVRATHLLSPRRFLLFKICRPFSLPLPGVRRVA